MLKDTPLKDVHRGISQMQEPPPGETHLYFQQGLKTFHISNNPGLGREELINIDFQWGVRLFVRLITYEEKKKRWRESFAFCERQKFLHRFISFVTKIRLGALIQVKLHCVYISLDTFFVLPVEWFEMLLFTILSIFQILYRTTYTNTLKLKRICFGRMLKARCISKAWMIWCSN